MLNLSNRENTLFLLDQGLSRREISKRLGVSHTSVNKWAKSHASNKSQKSGNFETWVETPEKSPTSSENPTKTEASFLDTVTGIVSPPSQTVLRETNRKFSLETGEILSISSYNPLIKWELQYAAKLILGYFHRIDKCCARIRPDFYREFRDVEIRGDIGRKPYFTGLVACGLIWLCPVCAAKIQAYRTLEVRAAIDKHLENGGSVWMVTQTVPHTNQDDLEDMLERFARAFRSFKQGKKWIGIKESFGISGYIKALEVTWSEASGWHPHLHTIFFLDAARRDVDVPAFCSELFNRWSKFTSKNGFGDLSRGAFSIQDASKVKEYLNKITGESYSWGSEHEITKLHSKQARNLSYAPFDFLRVYNGCSVKDSISKEQAEKLFRVYASAFFRMNHLTWSRGLKLLLLGSEGKTDEEIAESLGELDPILAMINRFQWAKLLKLRGKAWRGELLEIVREFGQQGLDFYFEGKGI